MKPMRWSAAAHGWFGENDEAIIFVSGETYEKYLQAHFEREGVQRKSLYAISCEADAEWERQRAVHDAFAANLDFWLTCQDRGIRIDRRES